MALSAFAGPLAGMGILGWPAPVAGIAAVLAGLDRTGTSPGRTPLLHSPAAAAAWVVSVGALALATAPAFAAGLALAFACGLAVTLALDALQDGEMFLWPATRSPSDWLLSRRPEDIVQLGSEAFVVPSADGAVPQAWGGWRVVALRHSGTGNSGSGGWPGRLGRHADILLSAGSLAALLAAVVLK